MSVFLRPLKVKPQKFILPEYGEDAFVYIRPLTSKELLALQEQYGSEGKGLDFNADFLCRVLVNEDNSPMFSSPEECKEHVSHLPLSSLERLMKGALEVSGVSHKEEADEKN